MTDPIFATLGTVASVAQIVDLGLRVSRECYTFLHAVKSSRRDIEAASERVNNVLSVWLSLKIYIEELKSDDEDGTVVPEAIARSAHQLQALLVDLRALLPRDLTDLGLYRRVKWATDAKRLKGLSQRLESEKSTLQLALQVAAQYECFHTPFLKDRRS
jgi:hypothetical protein